MAESFQQYIKIRTFLGYRPKEILVELQNAFGDDAPTYACIQRWSKRFRDAIDSPLGSPIGSQLNIETTDEQIDTQYEKNDLNDIKDSNNRHKQINANANKYESVFNTNDTNKSKQSRTARSK